MRRGSHCLSGPSGQGKINASAWCIDVGPDIEVTDNPIINSVVCSQLCHFPPSLPHLHLMLQPSIKTIREKQEAVIPKIPLEPGYHVL